MRCLDVRQQCGCQVKEDALTTFEQCEQINMDYCRKKNFAVRALRGALKFLAPLL
ncbi:hypothetical protein [Blautia sp. OF09-25XD]|uniref:hypothetical protein n=1 Tax=Blautia sp. OF09-25XD TaxID=2292981 RepID=UPI002E8DF052|nr:hypothetical protein [Blautia sp. OF09-25XD]